MEVSVVIPTKDRLSSLQRVLPSFLLQDEVKEIVVIVDGSTDGTLGFLEEFCRDSDVVRYIDNGVNRGLPYSRNRGIDAAKCDYIFMAEDDLELTPQFLRILSTHMTALGVDVICGRNIFRGEMESAADSIARTSALRGPYVNMKSIEIETGMDIGIDQEQAILASPMLAKTSLYRQVRYNEMYIHNFWREETDFQLSAREQGFKLGCCPHAICFNFEYINDRGGVHALTGLRRETWVVINNWRFVRRHERLIRETFAIGNVKVYIVKFALGRLMKHIVVPRVLKSLSHLRRRFNEVFVD